MLGLRERPTYGQMCGQAQSQEKVRDTGREEAPRPRVWLKSLQQERRISAQLTQFAIKEYNIPFVERGVSNENGIPLTLVTLVLP